MHTRMRRRVESLIEVVFIFRRLIVMSLFRNIAVQWIAYQFDLSLKNHDLVKDIYKKAIVCVYDFTH